MYTYKNMIIIEGLLGGQGERDGKKIMRGE
jgi:hypothetical protein